MKIEINSFYTINGKEHKENMLFMLEKYLPYIEKGFSENEQDKYHSVLDDFNEEFEVRFPFDNRDGIIIQYRRLLRFALYFSFGWECFNGTYSNKYIDLLVKYKGFLEQFYLVDAYGRFLQYKEIWEKDNPATAVKLLKIENEEEN